LLNHTHIKLLFELVTSSKPDDENLIYAYYHNKPSIYQACTTQAAINEAHYDLTTKDSGEYWHTLSKLILVLNHKEIK